MFKKCKHCGFKNPPDIGDCLFCHRDLPMSVGETVSSLKYRFHPVWILKVKLHHLKQSLISFFWIMAIIAGLVILGAIFNFFKK